MGAAGLAFIGLRQVIPDWVSIVLANGLVAGGMFMLYFGLLRFTGRKLLTIGNTIILAGFAVFVYIHWYFTYLDPNLVGRVVNVAAALGIASFLCFCLLSWETQPGTRIHSTGTRAALIILALIAMARIAGAGLIDTEDYMAAGSYDAAMTLLYGMSVIFLAFNLVLMVNKLGIVQAAHAEEALSQSETRYRDLFENASLAVFRSTLDGKIVMVNPWFASLFGYKSPEEINIMVKSAADFFADSQRWVDIISLKRDNPDLNNIEVLYKRKDGSTFWGKLVPRTYSEPDGSAFIEGFIEDITERKKAEEALAKSQRLLVEAQRVASVGSWEWDIVEDVITGTDEFYRLLDTTPENFTGIAQFIALLHPHDRERVQHDVEDALQGNRPYNTDYGVKLRGGELRYINARGSTFSDADGKPIRAVGTIQDITERKIAEEKRRAADEKFRNVFDNSSIGKSITAVNGSISVNRALADMLGYTIVELSGLKWPEITHADDIGLTQMNIDLLVSGRAESVRFEKRYRKKDGSIVWTDVSTVLQRDNNGKPLYYITSVVDITARKESESALSVSETRFRELFQRMGNAVAVYQVVDGGEDFVITDFNGAAENTENVRRKDVVGRRVTEAFPGVKDFGIFDVFQRVWRTGQSEYFEPHLYRDERDPGSWRESWVYKLPTGEVVAIYNDITVRKQAELGLQSANERIKLALEASKAGAWDWDMTTGRLTWSPQLFTIFGLDPSKDQPTFDTWRAILHPDDRQAVEDKINDSIRDKIRLNSEYRIIRPNGGTAWINALGDTEYNEHGEAVRMTGLCIDVTAYRKAKDELQETHDYLDNLLNYSNVPIIVWNPLMEITLFNHAFERLTGHNAVDVIGRKLNLLFPSHTYDQSLEHLNRAAEGEHWETVEILILRKDGQIRTVLWNSANLYSQDGATLIATIAQGQDITERKKAENEVKVSKDRLQLLLDSTAEGIYGIDKQHNCTIFNRACLELLGFGPDTNLTGRHMHDLVHHHHPDGSPYPAEDCPILKAVLYGQSVHVEDDVFWKADGISFPVEYFAYPQRQDGVEVGAVVTFINIAERKLSEAKLLKSYESLKKTLNDAINTMVKIVELRDPYTAGHQQRVAELATAIGGEMKFDDTQIDQLRMAAVIHDIGKIYVPSDILSKPGKLTDIELTLIRTHAQNGYNIVKGMDFPGAVAETILQHHERMDGSGYPNGLKAEDTLMKAKILAVADVVEAMVAHRPYRPALGIDKALEEITKNKVRLYDPAVVDACLGLFTAKGFKFED